MLKSSLYEGIFGILGWEVPVATSTVPYISILMIDDTSISFISTNPVIVFLTVIESVSQ